MRSLRLLAPLLALSVAGCGDDAIRDFDLSGANDGPMSQDFAKPTDGGMGSPDLLPACKPDPMTDGQMCSMGCPMGTVQVTDSQGVCRCWSACKPAMAGDCVCGRACRALFFQTDMGLQPSDNGACIPANGPAERCGIDKATGKPWGAGSCGDGLFCVNQIGSPDYAYCMYVCTADKNLCPRGTSCLKLTNSNDSVCVMNSVMGGKAVGAACGFTDDCNIAAACDGMTCRTQCNGPKDTMTCAGGTCGAVVDPNNGRISAYVCK